MCSDVAKSSRLFLGTGSWEGLETHVPAGAWLTWTSRAVHSCTGNIIQNKRKKCQNLHDQLTSYFLSYLLYYFNSVFKKRLSVVSKKHTVLFETKLYSGLVWSTSQASQLFVISRNPCSWSRTLQLWFFCCCFC